MRHQSSMPIIGYQCGIGAENEGCEQGPLQLARSELLQSLPAQWQHMLRPHAKQYQDQALEILTHLNHRLAQLTFEYTQNQQPFAVIGGDHSSAIGTWSGAATALFQRDLEQQLGLIWIDAHMDSHTLETTPSGNIHGTPLANLLGHGDPKLTHLMTRQTKIAPHNLCLIGARSYESEEHQLLQSLGVNIFYMSDVEQMGMDTVIEHAVSRITDQVQHFGISLDLDAIDPQQAPGVGTPEPNGLEANALVQALYRHCHQHHQLLGAEIVEFNPELDQDQLTAHLAEQLMSSLFIAEPNKE